MGGGVLSMFNAVVYCPRISTKLERGTPGFRRIRFAINRQARRVVGGWVGACEP